MIAYPVTDKSYVLIGIGSPGAPLVDSQVIVERTQEGYFIYPPTYYISLPDLPDDPVEPYITFTTGVTTRASTTGESIFFGTHKVYWDGVGDIYLSSSPTSLQPVTLDDTLYMLSPLGIVQISGVPTYTGVIDITLIMQLGQAFLADGINIFNVYLRNQNGSTIGSSGIYLFNVRP